MINVLFSHFIDVMLNHFQYINNWAFIYLCICLAGMTPKHISHNILFVQLKLVIEQ
jgi:hypothetical protein